MSAQQLPDFFAQLVGRQTAGHDAAMLQHDVVGHGAESELLHGLAFEEHGVADVGPAERVALHLVVAERAVAVEVETEQGQSVAGRAALLLEHALLHAALRAPCGPCADDGDRCFQDVGRLLRNVRGGELLTWCCGLKRLQLCAESAQIVVVGLMPEHDVDEPRGLYMVGLCGLDEVFADDVGADDGLRVVLDELAGVFDDVGRRRVGGLLTESVHELVVFGAADLHLLQVRGVAPDADALAGLGKDGLFGEVGEDDEQGHRMVAGCLVSEASGFDLDGVDLSRHAVGTIDVELALSDVHEASLEPEVPAVGAAGEQEHA